MTIEEKAKAYDNALERAKQLSKELTVDDIVEQIFPELAESEDERIRKALIDVLNSDFEKDIEIHGIKVGTIIAWLERQSELTDIPADAILDSNKDGLIADTIRCKTEKQDKQEIKSKFHKGDWITNSQGMLRHILNVDKGGYQTDGGWLTHETYEKEFHLWTIQDAKAGDVLATLDYILIFKEHLKDDGGVSYCHYDFGAGNPQFIWCEDKNWYFGKEAIVHPATKEQRDLLFQKMHEAGYEWNAKKKELKKIEQKPAGWSDIEPIIQHLDNLGNTAMADILRSFESQLKWKPSEEQLTQLYYASTGVSYSRGTLLSLLEQLRELKE